MSEQKYFKVKKCSKKKIAKRRNAPRISWICAMDEMIGKTYPCVRIDNDGDILLGGWYFQKSWVKQVNKDGSKFHE